MEEYLNKVKQLLDQLKAKNLELPKQVIIAWILNNLSNEYEGFVGNITQSLRNNSESYNLETLFSNLLDESKRQANKDTTTGSILYTKGTSPTRYKGKKPYKVTKGQYCKYCKLPSHSASNCYFLFPDKAPRSWKENIEVSNNAKENDKQHPKDIRDENIDILYSKTSSTTSPIEIDMDIDLDNIEVYITQLNNSNNLNTNNNIVLKEDIRVLYAVPYNANFIIDTAATHHIVSNRSYFLNYKACDKKVSWGEANTINVSLIGDVYIKFTDTNKTAILKDCLYMPELGINLISQNKLQESIYSIFKSNKVVIRNKTTTITIGKKINSLYYLPIKVIKKSNSNITTKIHLSIEEKYMLLHQRFGHISMPYITKLLENTIGFKPNNTNNTNNNINNCDICLKAKFTNKINKTSNNNNIEPLEKIASDICGPISPNTYDNYRYFITFIDKATRYLYIRLLKHKNEAYNAFYEIKQLIENNKENKRIRILATDNGTEYVNNNFNKLLKNNGITHQLVAPYTKEPNGLVERINRTLLNKARALLYNANLPQYLWGEAILTAVYLYNRTPHSAISYKTPYEIMYKRKPNISNIYTFGSITYYKNKGNNITKLEPRANKAILLGYNENVYKLWDLEKHKAIWSRDIKVLENKYIKDTTKNTTSTNNIQEISLSTRPKDNIKDNINTDNTIKDIDLIDIIPSQTLTDNSINNDIDNSIDDSIDELALITIDNEPSTYKEAINDSNKDQWQEAMQKEIDELLSQKTWDLVALPSDRTALKGRWVYKYKKDNNNNIKYKARWVIKGYNQILGIDYIDTFSTTCRPESYRLIIILAIYNNWQLNQYDIKNAFVHATIDTEIYMEQPIGFNNDNKLVCKLNKALYGLKQSPRLWYKHLASILKNLSFTSSSYDEAIFIYNENNIIIIIICYVDDIIITGNNKDYINKVITNLNKVLKIQYLGNISQFLGLEFITDYINKTIYIHQNKYLDKIKNRFNKENLTPVSTPVELGVQLYKNEDKNKANNNTINLYQQQIGALIYLAINTRPDISFAINRCARYMANPNTSHYKALDRIWKYLNYKPNLGLFYNCQNLQLLGYTDADWGGDIITRKSTTGYLFLLGKNTISWNSSLQKTVALSSCEAEYMALKDAIKEALYLNNSLLYLLKQFNISITTSSNNNIPYILSDSQSAIKLAENPEFHKRTKHIDIIYHFIRETIYNKKAQLLYINTKEQLADRLTKGLDNKKHNMFIENISLRDIK
jgi:hypothetical protein